MPNQSSVPAGYSLSLVPAEKPPALREEIVQLWLQSGALREREKAEKRVDQVLAIARAADGSLAGVASTYAAPVPALGDLVMFHFRAFTAPAHRRQRLGGFLVIQVREALENRYASMETSQRGQSPIGLYIALENSGMHDNYNHAILPISMAVYIGDNAKGQRQYVYYFADARVPVTPIKQAPGTRS